MKKIDINWVRLAKASGIAIGLVAVIVAIILLGKYAPGVLLAIFLCILIVVIYYLMTIWAD